MKTFTYIIMLALAVVVFMGACSSQATVTGSKPVGQAQTETTAAPTEQNLAEQHKKQNQPAAQAADNTTQNNSSQDDSAPKDAGGPVETNEEEIAGEIEEDAREETAEISVPDAGQADAGTAQADAGNGALPADPHVFATQELGALVRVRENTEVIPAEKPFWADDALATAAFERESGMQYSVLVYERRPDELFADWLMRSKVGGTTVSRRWLRIKDNRRAYVYSADDYGAVPNVHIIVPTRLFVYYFRYEEETFEVPDDFIHFIREIEVQ